MNYYQVFIKGDYVRDAQAYTQDSLSDDIDIFDEEHEEYWSDVSGDLLVLERAAKDINEITKQLKTLYPDASGNMFYITEQPIKDGADGLTTDFVETENFEDLVEVYHVNSGTDRLKVETPIGTMEAYTSETVKAYDKTGRKINPSVWIEFKQRAVMMEYEPEGKLIKVKAFASPESIMPITTITF